jgi:aminocarboxymuconate-semialdehyde decarboxylase
MFIDVHGHLSPLGETGGGPPSLRDPQAVIARKRALGIGLTVIGSPAGGASMAPDARPQVQTAGQVKAHNELMGELVDAFPQDLRAYVYLDPFGGPAMLDQARELLADWRFVGMIVNSSVQGRYLDAPQADDFFAFAAEADVPILLHPPAAPVGAAELRHPGLIEHVSRFGDVTAGVAALVWAGRLEAYPELKLIAAAGGGSLGLLAEKLDLAAQVGPPTARPRLQLPPSRSLARVHVDTAAPSRGQLQANLAAFGTDRVLFGTDCPPVMDALGPIHALVHALPQAEQIGRHNALRLFGPALDTTPAAAPAGATRTSER